MTPKKKVETTAVVKKEAELQARFESRIRAALPFLPAQIKLEHNLHLRLGHHKIVIDGASSVKEGVSGRYDILVLFDGKPLLIAELKAPGIIVTDDDVRQGLSYARLHEPMVPLVLVTNGGTVTLRRSYDGAELEPSDVAAEKLASALGAAATLAASTTEDAIRTLLGESNQAWTQMLGIWSKQAVASLTGPAREFKHPIASEFVIPRTAVGEVEKKLSAGSRVIVIHGPPLSGVTNVLAQFACRKNDEPVLFLDSKSHSDVLQTIANRLSRELSCGISKDNVRTWLNTGQGLVGLTLVIDGVPRDGIDELVEYATAGLLRLIIGMDSGTHKRMSTIAGRAEQSLLGCAADEIELSSLSDKEFKDALNGFNKNLGALFFNGAQHIPDLRWPRTLRVFAAALPPPSSLTRHDRLKMLPPIPGPKMLQAYDRAFVPDPMIKFDLKALAAAFLKEAESHTENPPWVVATWGKPSLDPNLCMGVLGEKRIERLCEQGFLSWINVADLGPRLLVRIEELLLHYIAEKWAESLSVNKNLESISAEIKRQIRLSTMIPSAELALSAAIYRASQKNSKILTVAINCLILDEPNVSTMKEGAIYDLLLIGGKVKLCFDEEIGEEMVGNLEPWIVLSHLVSWPMQVDGYKKTANFSVFCKLGSAPHFLYRPKPSDLANVPSFHFHEIQGVGSFPCLYHTGIVEPLQQSMLIHVTSFPGELAALAEYALEQNESHLAWRVSTVALTLKDSADNKVAKAAKHAGRLLTGWWKPACFEHRKSKGCPP